jgi:TonB family protein
MLVKPAEHCVLSRQHGIGRRIAFFALVLVLALGSRATLLAQKAQKSTRPVITTVKPDYPAALQHAQIGGLVRLSATVLANGTVSKVQIRGGNPILADCASAAVMKWKYAPAATETVEEISLSFSPH